MKHFDNFNEAFEYSKTIKWKIETCTAGEICWCRMIAFEEKITYKERDSTEDLYICGSGCLPKEYVEYIVDLHNKNI